MAKLLYAILEIQTQIHDAQRKRARLKNHQSAHPGLSHEVPNRASDDLGGPI